MIKIRYSDLQPGLHASAETEGRHTVLYLVPGLSVTDRQSAIDRLRASAKVGHGPKLPAIPLALALIADRIAVNSRNAVAAARLHPTGLAIPAVVLTGAGVLYALLVTVSIHMGMPATSALSLEPLPLASAAGRSPSPGPSPSASHQAAAAGNHPVGPAQSSRLPGSPLPVPAIPAGHTAPGSTQPHQPTPSPGQPTISSSPQPSPSTSTPWTLSPSPSPSPSKTRSGSGKGHCLDLGLVHLCV